MSFYIARYGRVLALEGKISEPPLDTSLLGFENKFEDKDRAFYFRDKLREEHPRIFLKEKTQKGFAMSKKIIGQEDFRECMRSGLTEHFDEFWKNLQQLKPRDFVDGYLKALQYGFSRAPSEKELDDEEKQRLQQREQQRKQELIERGIQTEDMEEE